MFFISHDADQHAPGRCLLRQVKMLRGRTPAVECRSRTSDGEERLLATQEHGFYRRSRKFDRSPRLPDVRFPIEHAQTERY